MAHAEASWRPMCGSARGPFVRRRAPPCRSCPRRRFARHAGCVSRCAVDAPRAVEHESRAGGIIMKFAAQGLSAKRPGALLCRVGLRGWPTCLVGLLAALLAPAALGCEARSAMAQETTTQEAKAGGRSALLDPADTVVL